MFACYLEQVFTLLSKDRNPRHGHAMLKLFYSLSNGWQKFRGESEMLQIKEKAGCFWMNIFRTPGKASRAEENTKVITKMCWSHHEDNFAWDRFKVHDSTDGIPIHSPWRHLLLVRIQLTQNPENSVENSVEHCYHCSHTSIYPSSVSLLLSCVFSLCHSLSLCLCLYLSFSFSLFWAPAN